MNKKDKSYGSAIYGDGNGTFEGLEELKDTGTTVIELPSYMFFKDGRLKKKYWKRTTYPRL